MENKTPLTAAQLFARIEEYHKELGFPLSQEAQRAMFNDGESQRNMNNQLIAAIHNEVTELQESTPWKPWRAIDYKTYDMANMAEEVVDILFFLGAFMENNGLSWEHVERTFEKKMQVNYDRIKTGYSKTR